jgi:hypothetical protein
MKVRIQLTPEEYHRLKDHIPKRSRAYSALKNATELIGFINAPPLQFSIQCDESDAQVLLESAKDHCPVALQKIEASISLSRSPGT